MVCGNSCCTMPMGNEHPHQHLRKFFTKEEKLKQLKNYVEELKNEIKAVEELINELNE